MAALRLGTRGSALARAQTQEAIDALAAAGVEAEAVVITPGGDRDRASSLRVIGGQGVFVREIEKALAEGAIDVGVHSAKDVPTRVAAGTRLAACLRRADVRDALVAREGRGLADLREGARIGTSSRRRMAQLRALRPDCRADDIRGNVDTRLAKLDAGDYDAVVLAACGLARLGLAGRVSEYLTIERMLPAPGQGAIGLQAREDDAATLDALARIDDAGTSVAVRAERAVLEALGAGCTLPVAALAHRSGDSVTVLARVLSESGEEGIVLQRRGAAADPESVGHELGEELLRRGAAELLREAVP